MKPERQLHHEFVEFVPEELREGVVYVSIRFATASHLCCCGCGSKVVTPLRPDDWKLIFDGKSISLYPSIGNWSFPCQSHYWIRRNTVQWDLTWSQQEVELARAFDRQKRCSVVEGLRTDSKGPVAAEKRTDREENAQRQPRRWWDRWRMFGWW
jgi:hypothetical protein